MKHLMLPSLFCVVCTACLPVRLDKYRHRDQAGSSASDSGPIGGLGAPDMVGSTTLAAKGAAVAPQNSANAAANQQRAATIYAIDKQTFHFALREGDVWDAALNVLLRNYNLTIVDKNSGIVTTEWDSYFLNQEVFRNRLSLRISRGANNGIDVIVHNNVERLRDASAATGAVGAVWLPAEDAANETARVVQNMALVLNQPPPVLPPNSVVAGAGGVPTTYKK